MTDEQKNRYEAIKKLVEEELDQLDRALTEEVARARQRIEELQKQKKAAKEIYDTVCALLGINSVVEMRAYAVADEEKHA